MLKRLNNQKICTYVAIAHKIIQYYWSFKKFEMKSSEYHCKKALSSLKLNRLTVQNVGRHVIQLSLSKLAM